MWDKEITPNPGAISALQANALYKSWRFGKPIKHLTVKKRK
jgi:hypothetical protein